LTVSEFVFEFWERSTINGGRSASNGGVAFGVGTIIYKWTGDVGSFAATRKCRVHGFVGASVEIIAKRFIISSVKTTTTGNGTIIDGARVQIVADFGDGVAKTSAWKARINRAWVSGGTIFFGVIANSVSWVARPDFAKISIDLVGSWARFFGSVGVIAFITSL